MAMLAVPGSASGTADPFESPLARHLGRIHDRYRREDSGHVATYIPELGHADPGWFGIAAATLDGSIHAIGDADVPFTIQSISKPLTYGLILDDLGEPTVRSRIGVEPTGDAFNAITLDPATGLPLNPMVNAGAIAAAALVRGRDGRDPLGRLVDGYGAFVGRPVAVDRAVYESERSTGHRNRAIAHLLRASGAVDGDVDAATDRYFAQCSVSVTAADLAVAAATLAYDGVNPRTGERVVSSSTVRSVLAVMSTCGMYDGAGEWLYSVGLPAKSGVSGGILVVVPGRLGLGFFSPRLDGRGNSVRGVRACRDLVHELGLHPLGGGNPRTHPLRSAYSLAQVGSRRRRSAMERTRLSADGDRVVVVELQGDVTFLTADAIAGSVRATASGGSSTDPSTDTLEAVVIDVRRATRIDHAAVGMLADLVAHLRDSGIDVTLSGRHRHPDAVADIERALGSFHGGPLATADDLDRALEAAEDRLLERAGADHHRPVERPGTVLQDAFAGLDAGDVAIVARHLERRTYASGSCLVRVGDPATELYLVETGRLSVGIRSADGAWRRLSTLGPGMSFGETALLGDERRGADVVADGPTACLVLPARAFATIVR
ncbi:MAG TPA: glutaminase A, partial [Candidatus Limnocylindrales bacterium]